MKNLKRLLVSLLALILVFTMIPLTALAEGTGTVDETPVDTSAISTPQQFIDYITADLAGNYYLTADLDFRDLVEGNDGKSDAEKVPYEVEKLVNGTFTGTLDGRGHSIYGFKLVYTNGSAACNAGVFNQLNGAVISNLFIGTKEHYIATDLQDDGTASKELNFGFIAPATGNNPVTVNNVHVYGNADVTNTLEVRAGGFFGYTRDVTVSDCSFDGYINVTNTSTTNYKFIGGIAAVFASNTMHKSSFQNCINNADLTLIGGTTATSGDACVGGMVGSSKITVSIIGCTNNGAITSEEYAGGIAGQLYDNGKKILAVIADCKNTATAITGTENGEMYGVAGVENDTSLLRLCVAGCTDADGEGAAQNTPEYDASKTYDSFYDYIVPISQAKSDENGYGFDVIASDTAFPVDGFYCLKNNVDFGGSEETKYTSFVVRNFSGVFYGGGHTLEDLAFETTGRTGFFGYIANTDNGDTAIVNVNFGTAAKPVSVVTTVSGGSQIGIVSACAGYTVSGSTYTLKNTGLVISDVNVYADLSHNASKANIAGLVGRSGEITCLDCNVYGSFTSNSETKQTSGSYINLAAYVASLNNQAETVGSVTVNRKAVFLNCNNFADFTIDANSSAKLEARASGGVSYSTSKQSVMLNCNNFGMITAPNGTDGGDDNQVFLGAAAFIQTAASNSIHKIIDCANFGRISGYNAATAVSYSNGTNVVSGVREYGQLSSKNTEQHSLFLAYADANDSTTVIDSKADTALTMVNGASVRLAADTGLRFKATVNSELIARLERSFGTDEVSYGMLISPALFIGDGEFTHAALDKYQGLPKGEAYIDVPSVDDEGNKVWFKGENGAIAGSITGIDKALYKTELCGVAYINVNGSYVYASNPQTRHIYEVAQKALGDVKTQMDADNGYVNLLEVGETYYVVQDGEIVDTKTVGDGDVIYSYYNKNSRDTLKSIITDGDNPDAE